MPSEQRPIDSMLTVGYTMGMAELSRHQKKIVDRYYTHRDTIMLNKLQELVTELYLADTDRKRDALWKRVRTAMVNLGVKPGLIEHVVGERSAEILARNLTIWLKQAGGSGRS